MVKVKDLTGKRFGRLVVIELAGKSANGKYQWKCKCDCGNYIIVKGNSLTTGHTKSCGCLEKETKRVVNTVHGLRRHPLYKVWLNMKDRCYNPNNNHFKYYGGKGITMFDDWKLDGREFEYFLSTNGFNKTLEIDRINPDFGYEPWNIQFISSKDNKVKMMSDKKRSPQQIEEDRIKYFQRKTDFFKNYKKGKFIEEN